jgi:hypothetical protein
VSEHVHQHVPEELQELGDAATGRERIFEVLAIVLLSAAAIGTAWSGYQAARWSGREAHNFALADTLHAKSTRAVIRAGEDRVRDLADFERWLHLETTGDQTLANLHAAHFQGELRTAFDAWLAQDPLNNPNAIPTPLERSSSTESRRSSCSRPCGEPRRSRTVLAATRGVEMSSVGTSSGRGESASWSGSGESSQSSSGSTQGSCRSSACSSR